MGETITTRYKYYAWLTFGLVLSHYFLELIEVSYGQRELIWYEFPSYFNSIKAFLLLFPVFTISICLIEFLRGKIPVPRNEKLDQFLFRGTNLFFLLMLFYPFLDVFSIPRKYIIIQDSILTILFLFFLFFQVVRIGELIYSFYKQKN